MADQNEEIIELFSIFMQDQFATKKKFVLLRRLKQ